MSSGSLNTTGSVVSLWRYPVKSMMGEELNASSVTDFGLIGDRAYALIDQATGNVASAKNPGKWGKLLDFRADFGELPMPGEQLPPVRITLPDRTVVTSGQADVDAMLSAILKRQVRLSNARPESPSVERMDPMDSTEPMLDIGALMMQGRFSDYAAVHLLTTATIDRLRALYPQGRFEARRFRPNIVVTTDAGQKGFVENEWVGHTLAIGDEVRLRITDPCPRCAVPTLAQGDLPRDHGILRTVAQHNRMHFSAFEGEALPSAGVYAFVIQGGTVCRGDLVRIE